jgi:hypothetical protein
MSTEENKAKERRIVEEALNKGNLSILDVVLRKKRRYLHSFNVMVVLEHLRLKELPLRI